VSIDHITKKIKLGAISKIRRAPVWASIRKFGLKRARTRRIITHPKRWRKTRIRV
jgi:hypothetical protein